MTHFREMPDDELAAFVTQHGDKLPPRDADFAQAVIGTIRRKGVGASEKQRAVLEKFAAVITGDRPTQPSQTRQEVPIGDFAPIMALFDTALERLKRPAITLNMAGLDIKLSVASERASRPGTINVAEPSERMGERDRWFGRILKNGHFEVSPRENIPQGLIAGLTRFAADPPGVAAEYGRLTGKCCFCNRALEDERSTRVGYGPTCADNYGMPWGNEPKRKGRPAASKPVAPAMGPEDELPF